MDLTQAFYDGLAPHYDKLFLDWTSATREQADSLDRLFQSRGFGPGAELTELLRKAGCRAVEWLFPEDTGWYQPVVIGTK